MGLRLPIQARSGGCPLLRAGAVFGWIVCAGWATGAFADLAENFDSSAAAPAGWVDGGTANDNVNTHYQSAPNCRALGIGDTLQTPPVDYPTNLAFYVDSSSSGNGKTATVDYSVDGGANWNLLGSFAVSTAGAVQTFPLTSAPDLATNAGVRFRFNSTFNTWYLDNVVIQTGSLAVSNGPPVLSLDPAGTNLIVLVGDPVAIGVSAVEADGDEITLTGIDLPSGSAFAPNPLVGTSPLTNTFSWTPPAAGIYTFAFSAADKDGTHRMDLSIGAYAADPTLLLSEDFDASVSLPADWTDGGTENHSDAGHYSSPPHCRAFGSNDVLATPVVDFPTNLSFYADASSAGNGKIAEVSYRVGTNDWLSLGTFPASTAGAIVSFPLVGLPDLSTNEDVQFRFSSSFMTWYLDDVLVRGRPLADQPPTLSFIGPQLVALSNALSVAVVATDYDQDDIVLSASNLPPGALFATVTNAGGATNWLAYAPEESEVGMVYTSTVYAVDVDGTNEETFTISVFERLVGFAVAESEAWERDGALRLEVVLSRPGEASVEVVVSGTATPGADYALAATNLAFTAEGSATQYVELVLADDAVRETPETVVLDLANPVGAAISLAGRHVVSIRDDDAAYYNPFDENPGWSTQGQWAFGPPLGGGVYDPYSAYTGTNVYGYNLAGNYANNLFGCQYLTTPAIDCTRFRNVRLQFARWLGMEGGDYAPLQVSVDRQHWVDVWDTGGATVFDWDWTVVSYDLSRIADGAPALYVRWGLGPTDSSTAYGGWNIDDVLLEGEYVTNAIFRFSAVGYSARETSGEVSVTIERVGASDAPAEIGFATSNQTAVAGADYQALAETLVFAPGETNRVLAIPLLDDADAEGDETIGLHLIPTASGDVGTPAAATLVLQDDESPGVGLPFFDGFEADALGAGWAGTSSGNGRILVGAGSVAPCEGSGHVSLDATNYAYGLNELVLTADLSGQTNVLLDFNENNYDYAREAMPDQFMGSTNADGVAISVDGLNWHRLADAAATRYVYANRAVNLSAFAASNGLALGANVEIKFQQYDRYPLPVYGRCFDNVQLYDPTQLADVRLTVRESGDPVAPGSNLVYALTVSNAGPLAAANVVVSNQLPIGVDFIGAESSQGECVQQVDVVTCQLGDLALGASATVSVTVTASEFGVLTNRSWAAGSLFDPFRTNNWVVATTLVDEPGGTLQLAQDTCEVEEKAGAAQIAVIRTDHAYGEISVDYATADGSAVAGEDYEATAGTLVLTNGQMAAAISIPILDDEADESAETFALVLGAPDGGAILGVCTGAVVSIGDDDGRAPFPFLETFESGALSNYWRTYSSSNGRIAIVTNYAPYAGERHLVMDSAYSGTCNLNELTLTVDLSGRQGVTLAFWQREFGDEDQTMSSSFNGRQNTDGVAMSANGTNWVKVTGLTAAEGSSNGYSHFEVALDPIAAAYGLAYTSTFKIKFQQYDDFPIATDGFAFDEIALFARQGDLRFSQAAYAASETGGVVVVDVERVNGSSGEVSVPYAVADGTATAGADYVAVTGTLVFASGATTGSFAIALTDDWDDEPAETILLALGAPTGGAGLVAPSNAVLTLSDDDGGGEFAFSADAYAVAESNGSVALSVWRLGGAEGDVSVDYATADGTASNGLDYVAATGTLVFAAGVTQQQFSVSILDDAEREDAETIFMSLANPAGGAALGAPSAATLQIVDDEDPNYDYYAPAYGKEGPELRQALHDVVDDHVAFSYDAIWTILQQTDECPTNASQVQLIYMQSGRDKSNHGGNLGQWNREHVWPQSHGFPDALSTAVPPSVDAHNLRPSDVAVNSLRGEKDFDAGGAAVAGAPATCLTTSDTFEPPDAAKGDVARALFYMDVRYAGDKDGEPDLQLVDAVNTSGTQLGKLSTLIRWHFQDPPDDFERQRNNLIYANWQGNRNPFVDHPEWVLKVWEYNFAIATVAGAGGAIAPANPQVPYQADQLFEIQPDSHWHVVDVRTNGVSLGADYGPAAFAFTWGTIVTNGTLEAVFAPNLAAQGTPEWWLAEHGFSNDFDLAELTDLDFDGMPAWQEFLANTDPASDRSLLQFEEIAPAVEGNETVLRWQSASNRVYSIWRAAALPDGFGLQVATNLPADPPQNAYTDRIDGAEIRFYRIEAKP